MTSSMSHGNRWRSVSSKLSLNTRFVCVWTSFSTNFWSNLFLLWEWIHPSIDQQFSHTDSEQMTPETLYANQPSSLNRSGPVLLSVTPSTNVAIQVCCVCVCDCACGCVCVCVMSDFHRQHLSWERLSISGVKAPWASSLTSSSKRYCTSNVVCHDCVSMCTKKDYGLHCHLFGSHIFLILCLHLAQILAPRSLRKILARPFLIIVSLRHSTNSVCVGVLISTVCPLSRHGRFPSALPLASTSKGECLHNLQPKSGCVFPIHSLLSLGVPVPRSTQCVNNSRSSLWLFLYHFMINK
jgi:hypothetical protein